MKKVGLMVFTFAFVAIIVVGYFYTAPKKYTFYNATEGYLTEVKEYGHRNQKVSRYVDVVFNSGEWASLSGYDEDINKKPLFNEFRVVVRGKVIYRYTYSQQDSGWIPVRHSPELSGGEIYGIVTNLTQYGNEALVKTKPGGNNGKK